MKNRLAVWRIERRLSQWELSVATGISRWKLQLIEAGLRLPEKSEREALSQVLGLKELDIFPASGKSISLHSKDGVENV